MLLTGLYVAPPVLWMGVIFFLSAQPVSTYEAAGETTRGISGGPYIVHGLLYFVLAFLIVRLLGRVKVRFPWLLAQLETCAAVAVVSSIMYGVSDEFHQKFVEGRAWGELDLLTDLLGASASAALWAGWRRWKLRLVLPDRRAPGAGQAEV